MDEDEVKMVEQWKAKGISEIIIDETEPPASREDSPLKPADLTRSLSAEGTDEGRNT